jgi:hypothetical protein
MKNRNKTEGKYVGKYGGKHTRTLITLRVASKFANAVRRIRENIKNCLHGVKNSV